MKFSPFLLLLVAHGSVTAQAVLSSDFTDAVATPRANAIAGVAANGSSAGTVGNISWVTDGLTDPGEVEVTVQTGSGSENRLFATIDSANHIAVANDVGAGGEWFVSINTSLDGSEDVQVGSVVLDFTTFGDTGNFLDGRRAIQWQVEILNLTTGASLGGSSQVSEALNNDANGEVGSLTLCFNEPIVLSGTDDFEFRVTASQAWPFGVNGGLAAISFNRSSNLELSMTQSDGTLSFDWLGQLGKQYDLRSSTSLDSDPTSWSIYDDGSGNSFETLFGDGAIGLMGLGLVDETRFFVLTEEAFPRIFLADFEEDNGGFTISTATGSDWEWGVTDSVGFSFARLDNTADGSDKVWGTNLSTVTGAPPFGNPGRYEVPTRTVLSSPVIDLTSVTTVATVFFNSAADIGPSTFGFPNLPQVEADTIEVFVVDAVSGNAIGGPIYTPERNEIPLLQWEKVLVTLPAEALGQMIRLEFRLNGMGGESQQHVGWYIDNVEVRGF